MKKILKKMDLFKITVWITLFFFTSQPLLFAAGAIADGSQPEVQIRNENGTEIVDIANPNAQGLSHNKYQQFNVGPNGLVFSNSAGGYQSQIIGGMVAGNSNLTNGPAKTILNEVTALNISQLKGQIEVGGNSADIIIANPNGIVGNNFGFINTNRIVMTTGTPQIVSGNLTGFSVQQGHISLEGASPLEVSGSKVSLLSRTMQINTQLQADTIQAVSGQYDYAYSNGEVTATESSDPKPQVGIDISSLGGMYANRIILVGTEKGVGVNSAGALSAIGGNIEISNDGKITLKETQATKVKIIARDAEIVNKGDLTGDQITLTGKALTNQGTDASIDGRQITFQIDEKIWNRGGSIHSTNDINLIAKNITNDQGTIQADKNIKIQGTDIVNEGISALIESQGNIQINATSKIQNQQGSIKAQKDIETHSASFVNESGLFSAEKNIQIEADSIVNRRLDFATQDVTTQHQDWNLLYNDLPGNISVPLVQMVSGDANATVKPIYTTIVEVTETTTTTTHVTKDTGAGKIEAGENLKMEATSILNDKSDLLAGKTITLKADQITNIGLELQQVSTVEKWQVKKGWGSGGAPSSIVVDSLGANQSSKPLGMAGGRISAEDAITISTDLLTHQTIGSQGAVIRDVIQGTSRESGALLESDIVDIQASRVQNSGTIHGKEKASIQTQELTNSQGRILGEQLAIETSGNIINRNGEIHSKQDLFLKAENIINETTTGPWKQIGRYVANNSPTATAIISSDGDLTLQAKENIILTGSGVVADGDVVVVAGNDIISNTFTVQENSMLYGGHYVRWQGKFRGEHMNVGLNKQATYEVGSLIASGKDIYMESGQNISLHAATVQANEDILTYSKGSTWITPGYNSFSMQQKGHELPRIESVFKKPKNKFDRAFIERWYQSSNHYGVDVESSEMYAGGKIQMLSENDILLQSTLASSLDGTDVVARKNIDILADKDRRWGDWYEKNSKSSSKGNYGDEYVAPSYLVSDGDVNVVAGYLGDFFSSEDPLKKKDPVQINPLKSIEYLYHDFEEDHGGRLRIQGSTIQAGKKINLNASQDIILDAIGLSYEDYYYSKSKKSNGLSKTKTTTIHHTIGEIAHGSSIFGESVGMYAGGNIKIEGSEVLAINDLEIIAGKDIDILAAKNTQDDYHMKKVQKSGFSTSGITGISYGKESTKNTDWSHHESYTGSAVGSLGGDVTLIAGGDVNVVGSSVQAVTGDIYIAGDDVNIDSAIAESDFHNRFKYKKSGVTISVSNGTLDALNMAYNYANIAKDAQTDELRYTAGAKATLELNKAYEGLPNSSAVKKAKNKVTDIQNTDAFKSGFAKFDNEGNLKPGETLTPKESQALKDEKVAQSNASTEEAKNKEEKKEKSKVQVTVSIGSQSISSKQDSNVTTSYGSSITAGGDVIINARGDKEAGKEGDLTIRGSQVSGDNVTLIAKDDVNIEASQETQETRGSNKSSGWSAGVTVGDGDKSFGVSVSGGKGKNRGDGVENIESTVTAKDTLVIISGDDTNIIGSQVSGNRVVADVGGDFNIESLQDTNNYKEKQTSWNASASTTGSISAGYSNQKIDSEYKSVNEQAGIFAGEGGFDIYVEGNTDLKGAVIASEADAEKNKISTGTISYNDIENETDWKSSTTGVNVQIPGKQKDKNGKVIPTKPDKNDGITPNVGGSKDEDSSTTKSAISPGEIEVRDNPDKDLSDLSRDVENANDQLKPIFDKDKILEREKAAALFGEMGFKAVGDLAEKMGWAEGSPEKILLHGVIGGIMAEINGGKFGDGLTTAAINEILVAELAKIKKPLKDENGNIIRDKDGNPIETALISSDILRWISAGVGGTIGGNQGAGIADSATKNNYALHPEYIEEIKRASRANMNLDEESAITLWDHSDAIIVSGEMSLSLIKSLPSNVKQHMSAGGTAMYVKELDEWFYGGTISTDGNKTEIAIPVSGTVSGVELPKRIKDIEDPVERKKEIEKLMSGLSMGGSLVLGVGVTVAVSTSGERMIGIGYGASASLSVSFSPSTYKREKMAHELEKVEIGGHHMD